MTVALTLRGTVGEERYQQRHIVNVLQVGPHLVDAPGQLGLEKGERPVASGWEKTVSPPSLLWTQHSAPSGCMGAQPPSYPVAVLQETGEVTVCRLEADEIRVTLLLHQKEPFCIISGHCRDKSLSLTLGLAPGGCSCPAGSTELPASRSPLLCQLSVPQGDQSHFPREGGHQDNPWRLFLAVAPRQRNCPCPPHPSANFALTLIQVIMQGASVAGAGGGDLRVRHVTIGRKGDVAVPACLQAHLFCKHLQKADGNEQWAQKPVGKRVSDNIGGLLSPPCF